ncbi:MAG: hypothetical protein N4A38_03730 [Candidatus Gracilibacteria bacterium]|nr:hypothetical protein [Candidatus Gracilibacteria bacterium]
MPLIRRAFEMKVEGNTHKEISKYLLNFGDIKIGERELTNRLFKNTVYIGKYTEKTSGTVFDKLEFFESKTPISLSLWTNVQNSLGKKRSKYGEGQKGDILAEKLRTENGRRMSRYLAKKKYPQYMNAIEKINVAEHIILKSFLGFIDDLINAEFIKNRDELLEIMKKARAEKKRIEKETGQIFETIELTEEQLHLTLSAARLMLSKEACNNVSNKIQASPLIDRIKGEKKIKNNQIEKLKKQKEEIKQTKMNLTIKFANNSITKEIYDDIIKKYDNDIKKIDLAIEEFLDDTDFEKYITRLPEVLSKTFELANKIDSKGKSNKNKDDLLKLIEITTFELTITNKKELKVKLFDVLNGLFSSNKSSLEAPSGIEPD